MMLRITVIWHECGKDWEHADRAVYKSIPFGGHFSGCLMGYGKKNGFQDMVPEWPFLDFNEWITPTLLADP